MSQRIELPRGWRIFYDGRYQLERQTTGGQWELVGHRYAQRIGAVRKFWRLNYWSPYAGPPPRERVSSDTPRLKPGACEQQVRI